jgi:membrane-associated phospholipid phosphatase
VRASESLAFAYFAACAAIACITPLPASRRFQIATTGASMCAAIWWTAVHAGTLVRDWAPGVSILVGYYVSGRFFVAPSTRVEEWLADWDRRLLGDPATRFTRWPRALLASLEIVYMGCFCLVPGGFAVLVLAGRGDLADHYWTIVTAAELGAFAPLIAIQTRPPWMLERKPVLPDRAVHRAASLWAEHVTIRANTFPSGHVAGSLAVAFVVLETLPSTGVVTLVLALAISVATVVGRYHYIVDGVAGAALAAAVWTIVRLAGI